MRLSFAIQELQYLQDEHGDVDLVTEDDTEPNFEFNSGDGQLEPVVVVS